MYRWKTVLAVITLRHHRVPGHQVYLLNTGVLQADMKGHEIEPANYNAAKK